MTSRAESGAPRVLVLGLGSVLMGDDALGPQAVRVLEARFELPPEVELLDCGAPGHDLIHRIAGPRALIVVDTLRAAGDPGELRLYRRDELLDVPPGLRLSPHDPGLREAILTADLAGRGPEEVLLVGVVPERVELGTGLSEPVERALPKVIEAVIGELLRLGHPARRRSREAPADLWWLAEAV